MKEVFDKVSQLKQGDSFFKTGKRSEQSNTSDECFIKEIPNLRIVKAGEAVCVPSRSGHYTRVFLKESAILQRVSQKNHPSRSIFCTRIPVLVMSAEHRNTWYVGQGKSVDTLAKHKKIPKKLKPEIISRLRQYAEKLKTKPGFPEASLQREG